MEPWELVANALVAGAAAGMGDVASSTVRDAYHGLRTLTAKALRRGTADSESDAEVDANLANPAERHAELVAALSDADVAENSELLTAAQRVLELVNHPDSAGKYSVTLRSNKGVQVGDDNTQMNTFGN